MQTIGKTTDGRLLIGATTDEIAQMRGACLMMAAALGTLAGDAPARPESPAPTVVAWAAGTAQGKKEKADLAQRRGGAEKPAAKPATSARVCDICNKPLPADAHPVRLTHEGKCMAEKHRLDARAKWRAKHGVKKPRIADPAPAAPAAPDAPAADTSRIDRIRAADQRVLAGNIDPSVALAVAEARLYRTLP